MIPPIINIVSAEHTGDFCLRLQFDDGMTQIVDFKPFLAHARHPDIRAWLDADRFATFRLEFGELVWGDHELCFPMIDLYRNQIEHHDSQQPFDRQVFNEELARLRKDMKMSPSVMDELREAERY